MGKNGTVKTINLIIIITLCGKLLGLYRDRLIGITFGTGMEANAFLTASLIPRVFFDVIFASAITSCFIPVFNEYMERDGRERAFAFSHSFTTLITVATVIISVLGMVFAGSLVGLFGEGFDGPTAELCGRLLVYMFPTVIFTGLAFVFVGILQSMEEFNIPAAISVISNLVIILYFFLFGDKFGVYGLAVAFVIGWLCQVLIQLPSLKGKGYYFRVRGFLKDEGIKKVLLLMAPVMVSTWVQPVNISVATRYASFLYEGSGASAIQYANNLYIVLIGVIVLSITNVIFPMMAKLSAGNQREDLNKVIGVSVRSVIFILIPLTAGTMLLSGEAVNLIYGGGEFNAFSLSITEDALLWLSIGMLGYGIQAVLTRAFFAAQKGKIPLFAGICAIGVNVIFCMLLVPLMGIKGLALASSLASIINAAVLWIPVQKSTGALWNKEQFTAYGKMLLSAALMSVVVWVLHHFIVLDGDTSTLIKLAVFLGEAAVGCLIYILSARLMRLSEVDIIFNLLKRK